MRTIALGLILLGFAGSTFAVEKTELDNRIRMLTAKFDALQQKADKSIPAEHLRKAQGIVLLDRTKAGFVFAFQGGGGVALVKDPRSERWSPAAFLGAHEASLGFQIGGEQSFFVILFMNTNATRLLIEPNIKFGGEARGTAGDSSTGAEGIASPTEPSVLVYAARKGLYGGAAIKGGAIAPDDEANRVYYAQFLTMDDILFQKKAPTTEAATELAAKVTAYSKDTGK
jgi:lipid-binding SYLF domain-containing protein